MTPNHDLVSPQIVAERLGVARATILRWVRDNRLPSFRCGSKVIRLSWSRVLAALEAGELDG